MLVDPRSGFPIPPRSKIFLHSSHCLVVEGVVPVSAVQVVVLVVCDVVAVGAAD